MKAQVNHQNLNFTLIMISFWQFRESLDFKVSYFTNLKGCYTPECSILD